MRLAFLLIATSLLAINPVLETSRLRLPCFLLYAVFNASLLAYYLLLYSQPLIPFITLVVPTLGFVFTPMLSSPSLML